MSELFVCTGEPSGDALAAPVVRALGAPSFGWGGPCLSAAGTELTADLERVSRMGTVEVLTAAPALVLAARRLLAEIDRRAPAAALLVGFSEFNAWLAPRLQRRGLPTLWLAPPQIWAWRKERGPAIARSCTQLAVTLPFELDPWLAAGANVAFVGHPAVEPVLPSRAAARAALDLTPRAEYVALLPGSREHEIARHLDALLGAMDALRAERGAIDARVIAAPGLSSAARARLVRGAAARGVALVDAPALRVLPAFDVAVVASGTATLECALAGVPPVIVYRAHALTAAVARRMVSLPHVALPNLVLDRRAFTELLQDDVTPENIAEGVERLLVGRAAAQAACRAVRDRCTPEGAAPSERVAALIAPWLAARSRAPRAVHRSAPASSSE